MKNILIKFLKNQNKCSHKNALINSSFGYCPDCGKFLIKNYYLVRCSCCDIKREAKITWGEIEPQQRFCSNCGASEYYIEKIEALNFIDVKFAVCLKEIANEMQELHPEVQIWVDNEPNIIKQIGMFSRVL